MRLLAFIFCLLAIQVNAQPLWRNFFTTNQNPRVTVVAGSNATVQASTVGTDQRIFTVNGMPSAGGAQTNISWTAITNLSGAQMPLSVITNAGTAAYSNANVFEAAGTVQNATNGLWSAVSASTNSIYQAATNTAGTYKTDATNGIWSAVSSSTNSIYQAATNTAGTYKTDATNGLWASMTGTLPPPTNAPTAGARIVATSGSSTAWTTGFLTNANYVRPDFDVPYSELTTNDAFAFLTPTNASTLRYQPCVVLVTNSTAAAKAVTAPPNVRTTGTWYVTNFTIFSFFNMAGRLTNAIAYPVY